MKNTLTLLALLLCLPFGMMAQETGFLGVRFNQVDDDKAEVLNFETPDGYYLTEIYRNSAAEKAGLQPFDYIYQVDGVDAKPHSGMDDLVDSFAPGQELNLSVIRNGEALNIPVVLGNREDAERIHRTDAEDPFLGIHYNYHTPETAPNEEGVYVLVQDCSTAQALGMQDGDRIYQIDDWKMIDWHDLGTAIDNREVGDPIRVYYVRDGVPMMGEAPIMSEDATGEDPCPELFEEMPIAEDEPSLSVSDLASLVEAEREVEENRISELTSESAEPVETRNFEPANNGKLELTVFPNPSYGAFTVRMEIPDTAPVQVRILDIRGSIITQMTMTREPGIYEEPVDLTGLAAGNYFIQLRQRDRQDQEVLVIIN